MGMRDHKEYARQMRTNAVIRDGVVQVSHELWEQIATIIENSEEVVRCKDCKHLEITGCYGECGKMVRIVKPWDFCSYGERRYGERAIKYRLLL